MKTRETTYVDLRKNPPKINKGNISGGPKDVAAVMVGAIVDMMYPEKYLWLSAIVDTLLARWFYGVIVRSVDDSIIHGSCIGWIVWLMVVRSKFSWFVGVTLLLSSLDHSFGSWIALRLTFRLAAVTTSSFPRSNLFVRIRSLGAFVEQHRSQHGWIEPYVNMRDCWRDQGTRHLPKETATFVTKTIIA